MPESAPISAGPNPLEIRSRRAAPRVYPALESLVTAPAVLLAGIIILAAILRFAGLTAVALWGDEYGSIAEATTHLGANLTSLLYSLVLRVFTTFGDSVYILRLPAAIFGIAAVAALYLFASALIDRRVGLVSALLLATSAYAIGYSQEVRFYSLFLCTGTLALHALALLIRDGPTSRRVAWFVVANALCLASQPLGILVVFSEIVSLVFLTAPPRHATRRMIGLAVIIAAGSFILSSHQIRIWGFHLLTRYTASTVSYAAPRGIHLSNVVKIGWTYFVFAFGERVYPLWLWLTIPGTLLVAALIGHGLWVQRRAKLSLGILLPQLILNPIVLYLVFDAISSTELQGASPRYLIPLLSPFYVLIAAGIVRWRVHWAVALSLLLALALNGTALAFYRDNIWNYNGYSPDWPRVAALVARYAQPGTLVLVDGRSTAAVDYYAGAIERQRRLIQETLPIALSTARLSPRVIVIADTDRAGEQAAINVALNRLQQRYAVVDGFVRYPLFAYVMERKSAQAGTRAANTGGWRTLPLPVDIYGLDLEDLTLPIALQTPANGPTIATRGSFSLPSTNGAYTRTVALAAAMQGHTLLLATTLEDDSALPAGSPVASLTLSDNAASQTIVLRKGEQVADWRSAGKARPAGSTYTTGYRWQKLASLVGQRAYPEAYSQFTAGIAVAHLPLSDRRFTHITLRYLAPSGTLRVWGAAVR